MNLKWLDALVLIVALICVVFCFFFMADCQKNDDNNYLKIRELQSPTK